VPRGGRSVKFLATLGGAAAWPLAVRAQQPAMPVIGFLRSSSIERSAHVFVTGGDPLTAGLVNSLNRPGGNITGVSFISSALAAKQLELLRQLVPKATVMAALVDPNYTNAEIQLRNVQEAARSAGVQLRVGARAASR
jgi:ABC-type uncharacterized transport system substrate-binding protein